MDRRTDRWQVIGGGAGRWMDRWQAGAWVGGQHSRWVEGKVQGGW